MGIAFSSWSVRRAVEEWAVKQVSGAVRHGYPLWVVLADLDSYKPATDLFGHEAGDAMLRAFGEIIKKNTYISDTCGHMGGDQFTFVISHVSAKTWTGGQPLARQNRQL